MPQFEIRSVDDVLRRAGALADGAVHVEDGLRVFKQNTFSFALDPSTLLTQDGLDGRVAAKFAKVLPPLNGLANGVIEFRDVVIKAPFGLILDEARGICWRGLLINWSNLGLRSKTWHFERSEDNLDIDIPPAIDQTGEMAMIAAPGYSIYGHWIIDFLPRIMRMAELPEGPIPFYRQPEKQWSLDLANGVSPGCFDQAFPADADFIRVKRLLVPTTSSAGGVLESHASRRTWSQLGRALAQGADAGPGARLVYVSRRNWSKQREHRQLANAEAVESLFEQRGFKLVSPETLSLQEQRALFSGARCIAGEDGSGLHNCIFAAPGARIGVVAMGRTNIIHTSIANVLGQSVHYIETEMRGRRINAAYRADLAEVDNSITRLLDGL